MPTSSTTKTQPVQSLSVIALKVQANTFDLGSQLKHISIRDQIIRARMLARDLLESRQLGVGKSALIIGAGAAGLTLAYELSLEGVECWVMEKESEPMLLWRGVTERFVGPYMYEWPTTFYADQSFPPQSVLSPWVSTAPATTAGFDFGTAPEAVDSLRNRWLSMAASWISGSAGRLNVLVGANEKRNRNFKRYLKVWAKDVARKKGAPPSLKLRVFGDHWLTSKPEGLHFCPHMVFLTGGMGQEQTVLKDDFGTPISPKGMPFWANDDLRTANAGIPWPPGRIAIVGGGDGALQDTLRTLTKLEQPLKILTHMSLPHGSSAEILFKESRAELESLERQLESAIAWSSEGGTKPAFKSMHDACMKIVQKLASDLTIRKSIAALIRKDVLAVDLFVRESHFGKSYLLNRFLVLLFEECAKHGLPPGKATFVIHWSVSIKQIVQLSTSPDRFRLDFNHGKASHRAEKLVIRLGIEEGSVPGQVLGITETDTENRRELAQIRLPFWAG